MTKASREPETVEEITIDPTLGILAPRTEVSKTAPRKSAVALLIDRMIREQEEATKTAQPHQDPQPAILPSLQATKDAFASGDISVKLNRRNTKKFVLKLIDQEAWQRCGNMAAATEFSFFEAVRKRQVTMAN